MSELNELAGGSSQKYMTMAIGHQTAAMQYKARGKALSGTDEAKKHRRLGNLHQRAHEALAAIASTHQGHQETGRAEKMKAMVKPTIKENVEMPEIEDNVITLQEQLDELVGYVVERKPLEFQDALTSMIQDRASAVIDSMKIDIAQSTFATEDAIEEGKSFKRDSDEDVDNKKQAFGKRRQEKKKREVPKHLTVDEEVEQIDEISKKKLGNYIVAAGKDNENSMEGYYNRGAKLGPTAIKMAKRDRGVKKAVERLTKEEVEPIDEISSEKAKRYLAKAEPDYDDVKHKNTKGNPTLGDKLRAKKRFNGIQNAAMKEDVQ